MGEGKAGLVSIYPGPGMSSLEEPCLCWPQTLIPRILTMSSKKQVRGDIYLGLLLLFLPPP